MSTGIVSTGISVAATGVGVGLQTAAGNATPPMANAVAQDIYAARQTGVSGAVVNGTAVAASTGIGWAMGQPVAAAVVC